MPPRFLSIVRDNVNGEDGLPGRTDDLVGRILIDCKILGPTVERIGYFIPFGAYRMKAHDSVKHPRTIEIVGIPGRRNILIHRGYPVPPNSLGCVLTSKAVEEWLAAHVLPSIEAGDDWWCLVHEPSKAS